jgi:phosphoglycolate phosphatase
VIRSAPLAAVLLDLDGTLLDTAPALARSLNTLRGEQHQAALPFAVIRPQVSHGARAMLHMAFPDIETERFETLLARFLQLYHSQLAVDTQLFPGFDQVLSQLEAHRIPWGVVTNKPRWLAEPLLQQLGLYQRAGSVLSGDSLPVQKPDPLPLLTAARQLEVEPARCLYVGDALRDAEAARAAGMVGLGARYGYIGDNDDVEHWPFSAWIDEPLELLDWVGLSRDTLPPGAATPGAAPRAPPSAA